jgi:branched-chain amino acid transport system permease protein
VQLEIILQAMILGLLQGGIYALVAAGLTLVYGVMKVVNFAHGEFITLGMYLSFFAWSAGGLDPYAAAPFILGVVFGLAASLARLAIYPVLRHPQINQMLVTIGMSWLLIGLVQLTWGANNRVVALSWARSALDVGGLRLSLTRLLAFGVSMAVALVFWWFLKHTRSGVALRAAADSPDPARLCGIDVERAQLLTFALGSGLAALAGILVAPVFPMNPTIGIDLFLLPAFVIVVLGTMGNFLGALVGGVFLGVVESLGGVLLGSSLRQMASLALFLLVLLVLPRGLFGGRQG